MIHRRPASLFFFLHRLLIFFRPRLLSRLPPPRNSLPSFARSRSSESPRTRVYIVLTRRSPGGRPAGVTSDTPRERREREREREWKRERQAGGRRRGKKKNPMRAGPSEKPTLETICGRIPSVSKSSGGRVPADAKNLLMHFRAHINAATNTPINALACSSHVCRRPSPGVSTFFPHRVSTSFFSLLCFSLFFFWVIVHLFSLSFWMDALL